MNKLLKVFVAVFGAAELVFSIATPVLLSLLIVLNYNLESLNQWFILIVGSMASLYRGFRVWLK
jgi:hypothetical protein